MSPEELKAIQRLLKARIPTSFDSHEVKLDWASQTLKDISAECPPTVYLEERVAKERRGIMQDKAQEWRKAADRKKAELERKERLRDGNIEKLERKWLAAATAA